MKVLIIRFSSIGDIVLCTPIIRALKEQKNACVHFLCKKSFASVLNHNPHIDKVFHWDKKESNTLLEKLKLEEYDYVIDLHSNLRSKRVRLALGVPNYCLDKINVAKWLRVNLGLDILPSRHIVDREWDVVAPLDIVPDGKGLDFEIPKEVYVALKEAWPKDLHRQPMVALVVGAAHQTKQIPNGLLLDFIRGLDSYRIALLGGPSDLEKASKVEGLNGNKENVKNFCGQLSLTESAYVLKKADVVITSDTGLMHISAAFEKTICTIWGNTIPEFGMYPYLPKETEGKFKNFEVEHLDCRPCSKIGFDACPKGHFRCMKDQNSEEVLNFVKGHLKTDFMTDF